MLGFFPTPYPDEFFYSIIARYHIRSGNISFKQTNTDLLGLPSQQLGRFALPKNLNYLFNNLRFFSDQTVDNFIYSYTLYPYYVTFLTSPEAWLVKDLMKTKVNRPIFEVAKVSLSTTAHSKNFFKFCPLCVEEDTNKYGEAYWHRIHQTPGVLVCPIHATALQDSLVSLDAIGIHYHAASPENCPPGSNSTTYLDETLKKLLMFAKDIEWLVNYCYLSFQGMAWLRKQSQSYLVRQDFLKIISRSKFTFDSQSFVSHIFEFYGTDFLEKINPILIEKSETYFTNCLFACDVNPLIDRVTHLLLIKFLAGSIKDFFSSNV